MTVTSYIARPNQIIGNSWGASAVMGLAARRPDLVRSVIAHEPPLMSLVAGDPVVEPLIQEVQTTIERVPKQLEHAERRRMPPILRPLIHGHASPAS
jgi:pimeloyl-ACP methyl ester carboxylesterase